ncbi:DMT family transporter [Litorisediminicola beolgyonensis]|uniref:DMT family transporter n=1 Tax=Litorisediminicola beolgyonensis TaxID=1173614 RepID=A0ABW3ZGM6_9RHOB
MTSEAKGLALAVTGALVLTPDALFMRLSGMDGLQMLAWRAPCMGLVFLTVWLLATREPGDLRRLASGAGVTVLGAQVVNATLFPMGIALAPVAVMLLAVATVPVWSALLARAVYGETTSYRTWAAIAAVFVGIAVAVSGEEGGIGSGALWGVVCGLGVAVSLATSFVTLRHNPELPLLLAVGIGAVLAGLIGIAATGPSNMADGQVWAILITGLVILPISFLSLNAATRWTAAANVSLLMLLETVLGPLWVWWGIGEAPGPRALIGGAIVVGSLLLYLLSRRRRGRAV